MEQENKTNSLEEVIEMKLAQTKRQEAELPVLTWSLIKEKFSLSWSKIMIDPSFWTLFASNIVAIYFINKDHVGISGVMLIYWFQSVTIGVVNFVRILSLKDFSTENVTINDKSVSPTSGTKYFVAGFFAFHFGLFHFVYLIFILGMSGGTPINWRGILFISSLFLLNHIYSFFKNIKEETEKKNIGTVLFSPYARIIPMHLALIVGGIFPTISLNLFMFLKMAVDLLSHGFKHKQEAPTNI